MRPNEVGSPYPGLIIHPCFSSLHLCTEDSSDGKMKGKLKFLSESVLFFSLSNNYVYYYHFQLKVLRKNRHHISQGDLDKCCSTKSPENLNDQSIIVYMQKEFKNIKVTDKIMS